MEEGSERESGGERGSGERDGDRGRAVVARGRGGGERVVWW